MSHYYPEGNQALYYVEFERGDRKDEFTLFKRQWIHSPEKLAEIKRNDPKRYEWDIRFNEGHPWNIFTAQYGPPGSMPDESWVRFMVDCLNLACLKQEEPEMPATGAILEDDKELPPELQKYLKKG